MIHSHTVSYFNRDEKDSGDGKLHLRLDISPSFVRRTSTSADRDRIFGLMARLCRSIFTFQLSIEEHARVSNAKSLAPYSAAEIHLGTHLIRYASTSLPSLSLSLWTKLIDPENPLAKVSNVVEWAERQLDSRDRSIIRHVSRFFHSDPSRRSLILR